MKKSHKDFTKLPAFIKSHAKHMGLVAAQEALSHATLGVSLDDETDLLIMNPPATLAILEQMYFAHQSITSAMMRSCMAAGELSVDTRIPASFMVVDVRHPHGAECLCSFTLSEIDAFISYSTKDKDVVTHKIDIVSFMSSLEEACRTALNEGMGGAADVPLDNPATLSDGDMVLH